MPPLEEFQREMARKLGLTDAEYRFWLEHIEPLKPMMTKLETYWGIQLPDGYIMISEDEAKRLIGLDVADSLRGWIWTTSVIGRRSLVNFSRVSEIFESTPESRDRNREINRLVDEEQSAWEKANQTYDD